MSHLLARIALAAIVLVAARPAGAALITYDLVNLRDNRWEYQYTVGNSSLLAPIQEFSIYFDLGAGSSVLHADFAITGMPADWDGLLLRPDPRLPHAGLFDALALIDGIAPGLTLGGFAVQFTWLGIGAPAAQRYEIVDPVTFATLESGLTIEADPSPPTQIPEPSSLSLFCATFGGLLLLARSRPRRFVREG